MQFQARIHVTLKRLVNDPQGLTVRGALHSLGFGGVQDVRIGKYLELALDASDESAARAQVGEMCRKLLANPVIEEFSYELSRVG
jgi:phosphoribosylformylglycinamidine synthase